MSDVESLVNQLRRHGFAGEVATGAGARTVYGTDNSIYQLAPVGALVPHSSTDLQIIADVNHQLDEPFELVARGGGTGTNGQSLTNGIVVDTRRGLNRILSVDVEAREAVVEPGVVLGQLNAELRQHGLFFAPHVSTATRATIGGMVSTDAAGKGSLVYGRTNDHVISIDAVLADGTPWTFGVVSAADFDVLVQRTDNIGDLHRHIQRAVTDLPADAFPNVPRGFTGYNLGDVVDARHGSYDLSKLLCGSEGTLALISRLRLRLTPLASDPHLAVVAYPRFEDAVRDANRLKVTQPIAIECLDERTISLASGSPAWPALQRLLDIDGGSLLLMEYEGSTGVDALQVLLSEVEGANAVAITTKPADIAAVWKVRADAVGLLGQAVDGRRSIAFVEDCAVPPIHLEEFVAGYRELLDRHGLSYGMFGHADVGCIHVRPALDLYDPEHEALVRTVSDEVAVLVGRFGGVLWGEHGRGFRGEYLDLAPEVVARMRLVKTAFDPRNLLNPGKLYAPLEGAPPIKKIDAVPLRIHRDRSVAEAERTLFESAFGCNGNGICHHWGSAEVMCPSFKVTLDPTLSPKGRADLLRAWLVDPDDEELADDLASSLGQCLSCGACTGRCPVQVDVPEMKSRFLERHGEPDRRRRLRTAVLSRFEAALPTVQRSARVVAPLQRLGGPLVARLLGVVDLPTLPSGALARRLTAMRVPQVGSDGAVPDGVTVVILPDAFTAFIDPDVLDAAVAVLRAVGEHPAVAPFVPSGKLDHVKGRRRQFAAVVAKQRALVEVLADSRAELVVIEPAVAMLGSHEYLSIDPSYPVDAVTSLPRLLADRLDRLPAGSDRGTVQLFGHCTEVSLQPANMATYRALLERVGYEVEVEATSCCGMAGIFGHEIENQEMSSALFDADWRPRLAAEGPVHRCASGYSCRSQATRLGHPGLLHPVQVVARLLG